MLIRGFRRCGWAVLTVWAVLPASQAFDSATSACQQNLAYCAAKAGEQAVVPTIRGGAELASIAATLRILTPDIRSLIEQSLVECAQQAHTEVNLKTNQGVIYKEALGVEPSLVAPVWGVP